MPLVPIRDFLLGRLKLPTVATPMTEQLGSEVTNVGDATAVGQRRAKGFVLTVPLHGTDGDTDRQLAGNYQRRAFRSLMQNAPYRLAGVYAQFLFDPERNGWLILGEGELADANGGTTLAEYSVSFSQAFLVGSRHTHREGYRVDLTDMRQATSPIDTLGEVLGTATAFAGMTPLALMPLPVGASDPMVLDAPVSTTSRASADGPVPLAADRGNGDVISWERADADMNKGDVVAYDRRGDTSISSPSWEELYGPDYPYNWLTPGQPQDAPVLANGLCQVRYDPGAPGFLVDRWDGTAYTNVGKVLFRHIGGTTSLLDTFVAADVQEWTPDRAVIQLVLKASGDSTARDRVLVTLQRGWTAPRFEVYPAGVADGSIEFTAAASGSYAAAMSGGVPVTSGGTSFAGENWVNMTGGTQPIALAVLQSTLTAFRTGSTVGVRGSGGLGYVSAHLGFTSGVSGAYDTAQQLGESVLFDQRVELRRPARAAF